MLVEICLWISSVGRVIEFDLARQALHSLCLTVMECFRERRVQSDLKGQIYVKFENNVTMATQPNHNAYFTISVINKTTEQKTQGSFALNNNLLESPSLLRDRLLLYIKYNRKRNVFYANKHKRTRYISFVKILF